MTTNDEVAVLQERVVALVRRLDAAELREERAAEHLRLALLVLGRLLGEEEDGAGPAPCPACGGRGTVPTPDP